MMKEKIEKAFNQQINEELFSSYLYFAMSAYFEAKNLRGFANWMRVQAHEELTHVIKFYNFIIDCGGRVELSAIDMPQKEWDSPLAAFEASLKHEQKITGCINDLVNLSIEEKDHAANNFLQWFVQEQVEEESNVSDVVENLRMIDGAPGGLFMLNRELGSRSAPATE